MWRRMTIIRYDVSMTCMISYKSEVGLTAKRKLRGCNTHTLGEHSDERQRRTAVTAGPAGAGCSQGDMPPAKVIPEAVAGLFDCIQLNVPPPKTINLKTPRPAKRWCHPPNVATRGSSKCNGVSTLPRR